MCKIVTDGFLTKFLIKLKFSAKISLYENFPFTLLISPSFFLFFINNQFKCAYIHHVLKYNYAVPRFFAHTVSEPHSEWNLFGPSLHFELLLCDVWWSRC